MRSRSVRGLAVCALLAILPTQSDTVRASSTTIVISEFRVRGPNGGNDEFIELYNASTADVPIGGFKINGSNNAGTTSTRATINAGVTLRAGCFYLLTNSGSAGYSGTVPGNQTYATGVTDDGGIALLTASNAIVDQVGMSSGSAYKEGAILQSLGSSNLNRGYERKPGGVNGNGQDTDDNSGDFALITPSNPQNASSTCIVTTPSADSAPAVAASSPAAGATNVPVDSPIDITFSESVNATSDAFVLECPTGSPRAFTQSASPNTTFRLTPTSALPFANTCTVRVVANQVTDTDATDPPDQMNSDFVMSFTTVEPPVQPSDAIVVISQIYGGGGNSGATYHNDFVELFNRGTASVDLTGWSIQYASADGESWNNWQPLGGSIAPGEYLLIALASGGAVGAPLPPVNVKGLINMSATTGKIALVNSFTLLEGTCPVADASVMDFVGYGSGATCQEGTTRAPAPSNTTALLRREGGAFDTDRNGADFVTGAPVPRQTAPIVELGPVVLLTDPAANRVNVPRDPTIQITFTEPVETIGAWFNLVCASSGQHTDATFAVNGVSHYITPNATFTAGEQCSITIFKNQIHDVDTDDGEPNSDTLLADYSWTFTIATGTEPFYPSSVHLTMGNPSGAIASTNEPTNYLMEKPEFALSYNRDLGRPNWVSWHLSDEWVGSLFRVDTFRADPAVPPDWYRVQSFDFSGSGFDRGHMVPNADRDKETSIPINQATFLMTNMVAQAPDNNQGPWADMENALRQLLPANELYVVAGGTGTGGFGANGGETTTLADGHVTVPKDTWKVALVLEKAGGDDITRVTCTARTIAVIMPNKQGIRDDDWQNYLTTVDAVESLTGYNLFSNLPVAVQQCVEASTNGTNNKKNVPIFTNLGPATVELGTASVLISGSIGLDVTEGAEHVTRVVPPGTVAVSLNGVTVNAPIGPDGRFTAALPGGGLTLAGGPYVVGFSYAGDANFEAAAATSPLRVVDATAPTILGLSATPDSLGPPNHKLIDVTVNYAAIDLGGAPVCSLSVSSNESANGLGDGNTSTDWFVVDTHHVRLRAERSGLGSGRQYFVTATCTDGSGNASSATTIVSVPR